MNPLLSDLADFIVARQEWVTQRWISAIERPADLQSAGNLTYRQFLHHLPHLCRDLADRLRPTGRNGSALHHKHRWEPGYKLEEIVHETALLQQILTIDCLDEFALHAPQFKGATRREAEKIIREFLADTLVDSAQQFTAERQNALQASEQNVQAILDSALDSIIVIGEDGRVREFNPAAEAMFGYKRSDAVGKELASLIIPPAMRERHRQGLARYLQTGEGPLLGKRIEVPAVRADGSELLVELAITPYRVDGHAVFTAYLRDITSRVQSEKRRTAQYAIASLMLGQEPLEEIGPRILETIARSGPWNHGALWVLNGEDALTCHTTWQPAGQLPSSFAQSSRTLVFPRGTGYPGRALASGKSIWIADLKAEPAFPRAALAAENGLRGGVFFPLVAPDGPNGVIELFSSAVVAPDDDLLHLFESIGIQVGLYIQRKKTREDLRRQKEAAEAANQAKDRFLAALSHELRTPLNPVLMWASATIEDEKLDGDFKEGLRMICRNVELEARLIDDLLDLTRISRGKLQLNLQPCHAGALLEHALEIVRNQMTGKNLHLSVELKASNHRIMADPARIQQVFWNVLTNAIKFTPENGSIWIRSHDAGPGTLAIEISDSGCGLDAELMPRLFTAFEQGKATGEGLGLGLAICKAILDIHGGKISGANRPGGGALFTIDFATISEEVEAQPTAVRPIALPTRPLRILVLEDHDYTAAVMSKLLKRDGHEVLTAASVRQAQEILKTTHFDLLLSDLGLPDGNGFQVMQELAKVSNTKGIALSGYGMKDDLERSTRAGFSAHLIKPINPQELQETIQLVTGEW